MSVSLFAYVQSNLALSRLVCLKDVFRLSQVIGLDARINGGTCFVQMIRIGNLWVFFWSQFRWDIVLSWLEWGERLAVISVGQDSIPYFLLRLLESEKTKGVTLSILIRHWKIRDCFLPSLDKIWNPAFLSIPSKTLQLEKALMNFFFIMLCFPYPYVRLY